MDGRPPATAMSLLCSGEPRLRRRAAVRPAPGRNPGRPADTAAVSGSADTPGFRARSAQPADTDGPPLGQRTRPADTGSPQAAGAVDTRDRGMGTRTLRQRPAGQPATEPSTTAYMSGRERDRKVRHRPAPPWPDRQIRSLVLSVDLVGSRLIWAAHVGCPVDPGGSRRVLSDRLDDQRDDQVPSERHPTMRRRPANTVRNRRRHHGPATGPVAIGRPARGCGL
jgi:hypothetical protein